MFQIYKTFNFISVGTRDDSPRPFISPPSQTRTQCFRYWKTSKLERSRKEGTFETQSSKWYIALGGQLADFKAKREEVEVQRCFNSFLQEPKPFPFLISPPPPKASSGRLKGDFGTDNLPDLQLGDTHTIGTHRLLRDDQNLIIFYRLQVQRISSLQTCWYGDFLDYPGCGLSCSSRACRLTEGQHFWGKFPAED